VTQFFAAREKEDAARAAQKEAQSAPSKANPKAAPKAVGAADAKAGLEEDDPYDF
jgi:hypothetical protein